MHWTRTLRAGLLVFGLAGAGCAVDRAQPYADLERRLLAAQTLELHAEITSSGLLAADLSGALRLRAGNFAQADFAGEFLGETARPWLISDSSTLRGGSGEHLFVIDTPAALNAGMIQGLLGMGLLHNLAMLSGGAPPERVDGSFGRWLEVRNVKFGPVQDFDAVAARPLQFDVWVAGQHSAEATLWLDEASGLPLWRDQRTIFEQGDMQVRESYSLLRLNQPLPDHLFQPAGAPRD